MPKPKIDLRPFLPEALPLVADWVERHQKFTMEKGRCLTPEEIAIACKVGVQHPELVKILAVSHAPQFDHPRLIELAAMAEFPTEAAGVTYGYGVYLCGAFVNDQRVLAHELRHVAQVEQLGGSTQFLKKYCEEIADFGYRDAPLEKDARDWESAPFATPNIVQFKEMFPTLVAAILIVGGICVVCSLLSKGLSKA